jgi:hypothetical protein
VKVADASPGRLTLGLAAIPGLRSETAAHIFLAYTESGPFGSLEELHSRVFMPHEWLALTTSGAADALTSRRTPRSERTLSAVDMVDLVSEHVELRRVSNNRLTGRCPFHTERTPSFGIHPDEKRWNCFGCDRGGDAYDFVMRLHRIDFDTAVELLAQRYNPGA